MKQMPPCEDWIEKISADVDGELSLPECKRLADHLAVCEACRLTRQAFLQDRARFVAAFDAVTQGVDLTSSVLNRLARSQPRTGLGWPRRGRFILRPAWFWAGAGLTGILLGVILGRTWTLEKRSGEEPLRVASAPAAMDSEALRAKVQKASKPEALPWESTAAPGFEGQPESRRKAAGGMMGGPGGMGGRPEMEETGSQGTPPMSSIATSPSPPSDQAHLHLQVASPQAALIRAERWVGKHQGAIIRSEFPVPGGARQSPAAARLTCRVSRDQLAPLLEDLGRLGQVISRQVALRPPVEQLASSDSAKLKNVSPPPAEARSPAAASPPPTVTLTVFFSGSKP